MTTGPTVKQEPARAAQATPRFIGVNGKVLPWEQATVHISVVGWPSVSAVFEGIRAYWNADQKKLYVFALKEHMARLERSMKLLRMAQTMSGAEIGENLLAVLKADEYEQDSYIQPIAFASGFMTGSGAAGQNTTEVTVNARPAASHLLEERGQHAMISSWTRISDNVMSPRIKALPNYLNSRMVAAEARNGGYDAGIILNPQGHVAEGGGSCVFVIKDGKVLTPPVTAGILESITRLVIMELAEKELGLPVIERDLDRTEMYIADEAFFCGTMAEINPILSVDRYTLGDGKMGPITRKLDKVFHDVVRGINSKYAHYLTAV